MAGTKCIDRRKVPPKSSTTRWNITLWVDSYSLSLQVSCDTIHQFHKNIIILLWFFFISWEYWRSSIDLFDEYSLDFGFFIYTIEGSEYPIENRYIEDSSNSFFECPFGDNLAS